MPHDDPFAPAGPLSRALAVSDWQSATYGRPTPLGGLLQRAGLVNRSNLFWYRKENRNFGDWIGPWLFARLTGRVPLYAEPSAPGRGRVILSTGSILGFVTEPGRAIIWGSGIISRDDSIAAPHRVLAVRGPRTRDRLHRLGRPTSEVFGDPALLMPLLLRPPMEKRHRVGLIPHYVDHAAMRAAYGGSTDVTIIDVTRDVEEVIAQIAACEVTLSSSLHGLILSHAYGVPSAWVRSWTGLYGDDVKFADYYEAGQIASVRALTLGTGLDAAALTRMALDAPVPDNARLIEPLKACCPFRPANLLRPSTGSQG